MQILDLDPCLVSASEPRSDRIPKSRAPAEKKAESERANAREIKGRKLDEGVNARAKENAGERKHERRERESRWWSFQARAYANSFFLFVPSFSLQRTWCSEIDLRDFCQFAIRMMF